MANRRMFSLDIVNSDRFLDMSVSAQCLYFHLGMRADDDGFISSPRQIMRMLSCVKGDIQTLISKGYIIPFESGIVVIRHWKQNNYIRPDRYTETKHLEEKQAIVQTNGVYDMSSGIPLVYQAVDNWYTQNSIDKNSIVKDSIDNTIGTEQKKSAHNLSGVLLPLKDNSCYDVPLAHITQWKDTYPAVDVDIELKKMIAWLNSNPAKRKTRRGILRFINSWLSRTQNKDCSGISEENKAGKNKAKDIEKFVMESGGCW